MVLHKPAAQTLRVDTIIDYPKVSFHDFGFAANIQPCGERVFALKDLILTVSNGKVSKSFNLRDYLAHSTIRSFELQNDFVFDVSDSLVVIRNEDMVVSCIYKKDSLLVKRQGKVRSEYGIAATTIVYPKVYFHGIYNLSPKYRGLPAGYLELDLESQNERVKELHFNALALTHFKPNKFLDVGKFGYALAEPFLYKVHLFNFEGLLIDSLACPSEHFKCSDSSSKFATIFNYRDLWGNPAVHFQRIQQYLADKDRLWIMHFVNDTTIFFRVGRNSLKKESDIDAQFLQDHIWVKRKEHWKLTSVTNITDIMIDGDTINEGQLWPYFIPGSKTISKDGYLYYLFWASGDNRLPQKEEQFYGITETDRKNLHLRIIRFIIS